MYKIEDIVNDAMFERIGGYKSNTTYAGYDHGGVEHHPDIHALVFSPFNNSLLFSGTDGGIHKTTVTDATIAWANLNNNYQTYQYYHVALDPKNGSNMIIGGAQDNGTTVGGTDATGFGLTDNTTMSDFVGGDGVAVGISRFNNNADYKLFLGTQNGNMIAFHSTDGFSFSSKRDTEEDDGYNISPKGSSSQFITYFYLDPSNSNHLYYAGENDFYLTDDAENIDYESWTKPGGGTFITGEDISTMAASWGAYDTNTSYLLVGGKRGGIFRQDDPINTPSPLTAINITPSTASISDGTIVSGLAVHPTNRDIVLATYANYGIKNIYITANATSATPTWTLVEGSLDNFSVRSAAIAEVGGKTIYFVGTARGLYASEDPENDDWTLQSPNGIGLAVVSRLVYRPSDQKL